MQPQMVKQYRAELTLPHSTHSITSQELDALQGQVRVVCNAEGVKPKFDKNTSPSTTQIQDEAGNWIGQIATYDVEQSLSVGHTVEARRDAQRAA